MPKMARFQLFPDRKVVIPERDSYSQLWSTQGTGPPKSTLSWRKSAVSRVMKRVFLSRNGDSEGLLPGFLLYSQILRKVLGKRCFTLLGQKDQQRAEVTNP